MPGGSRQGHVRLRVSSSATDQVAPIIVTPPLPHASVAHHATCSQTAHTPGRLLFTPSSTCPYAAHAIVPPRAACRSFRRAIRYRHIDAAHKPRLPPRRYASPLTGRRQPSFFASFSPPFAPCSSVHHTPLLHASPAAAAV